MFDAAYLPNPTPAPFDVAAGYVYGQGAAHIWSVADWQRALSSRYLLPIATCWPPFGDPVQDALNAIRAWHNIAHAITPHGATTPFAIALDVEEGIAQQAHDAGYIQGWRDAVRSMHGYDIVYSSSSTAHLLGEGPQWIALGTLGGNVVVVQTVLNKTVPGGAIDEDVAVDTIPFYDTQPLAPGPGGTKMFVGIALFPDVPTGYWLVKDDGSVFAIGDLAGAPSHYHGGANGKPLAAPITGIVASKSGKGYYLVGGDGGVFTFGDAVYEGNAVGK